MFNELGLYLANLKEADCNQRDLLKIMAAHGIFHTVAGQKRGFETSIFAENGHQYSLVEDEYAVEMKKAFGPEFMTLPSDEGYQAGLWACVGAVGAELRSWYDGIAAEGGFDVARVQELTSNLNVRVAVLSKTPDPWQPQMGMNFDGSNFKTIVLSREIVFPLFRNEGHEFQRIRRCPECGTYFYAKDIRKVFCSNGCRSTNAYKAKAQQ
ncbi:hypothetical protein [Desulfovibrio desulfuricans]|uniref:hypothetical protein n=1 Tax=Desulfovibrio desulfuricans TaxID=876 RepID=UPI001AE3B9EE|nr:hypothetical protein [Desulfovibrio desulfuricans]QTO41333.1 hypothetical protein J8J02_05400 [Desulfovibrio desulfuricans]